MPKYVGQKDGFSCGPIALINTAKYYGFPMKISDLPWVQEECRTGAILGLDYQGTSFSDLRRACRRLMGLELRFKEVLKPTLEDIRDWVSYEDGVVILAYAFAYAWNRGTRDGAHYITISANTSNGGFLVHNGNEHKRNEIWTPDQLAARIRHSNQYIDYPWSLFVEARESLVIVCRGERMKAKEINAICKAAGVEFAESKIVDGMNLYVEEFDQGFGPRYFYYLQTAEGSLDDIQSSRVGVIPKVNKRLGYASKTEQGPAVKKGRPKKTKTEKKVVKKKPVKKVEKRTRTQAKKRTSAKRKASPTKQKRQYTISDEERKKRSERMREVHRKRWAKVRAAKGKD